MISRSFITGFRASISLPADGGGLIHPWLTASTKSGSETGGALARRRRTRLDYDAIAVCDQDGFACGRETDVFAEPVFEMFDANRSHVYRARTLLELEHHRFCLVGFRRRTPGPPPFSSMKSMPAAAKACCIFSTAS
jgi:hypothetical protein